MRRSALILTIVALLALVAPAAAANQTQATPASSGPPANATQIDGVTSLVDVTYAEDGQVARVTLYSATNQSVTLTDAGAFSTGGQVARREVQLDAGQTTTVAIPVTVVDGKIGVGISTQRTLYAAVVRVREPLRVLPQDGQDWVALSVGLSLGPLGAFVVKWRNRRLEERGWGYVE